MLHLSFRPDHVPRGDYPTRRQTNCYAVALFNSDIRNSGPSDTPAAASASRPPASRSITETASVTRGDDIPDRQDPPIFTAPPSSRQCDGAKVRCIDLLRSLDPAIAFGVRVHALRALRASFDLAPSLGGDEDKDTAYLLA